MGRKKKTSELLTAFELKVMNVIWSLHSASVADVVEKLKGQDYAYTTISTIMRGLEQKDILTTVKNGKTHIYVPELSKETYGGMALDHMVKDVFEEDPSILVHRLLNSRNLRLADLDEIRDMVQKKLKDSAPGVS